MLRSRKEKSMITILDAAKYFVHLSYSESRASLTPLKLQKILYFAQGWSFVWDNKPLFAETFEAWQYGPVNPKIYNYFKKYGRNEIPKKEEILYVTDVESEETMEAVWNNYGDYNAFELVEMTHEQTPWKEAYENNTCIINEDIKQYFQSTY